MKKKILFWIDSSLYNFINAKFIQEKLDYEIYSIFDVTNKTKTFFSQQKLVSFTKYWFFHDELSQKKEKPDLNYLETFENKFQINLSLESYNERSFYKFNKFYNFNSEEVLLILEQQCKFFEKILEEIKPDFLIMPVPFFQQTNILKKMCKKLGVKCLLIRPTRLDPNRCIIDENNEYVPLDFPKSSISKDKFSLEKIQDKLKSTKNFKNVRKTETITHFDQFKALIKYIFSSNTNTETHYTYYGRTKTKVLIKTLIASMKGRIRKSFLEKNSLRTINSSEKFIYFPLHQEEEETTLIGAPFQTDQFFIIENIIKSLPLGYKLYVKESPVIAARDWRKTSEYKKLLKLPNLRLIHPSVSPDKIYQKCSLVISIVGSAALESAYYMKPSIVISSTTMDNLNSVHLVKNIEELRSQITSILAKKIDYSDVSAFHDYVQNNSFSLNLSQIWESISNHFQFGGAYVDVVITSQQFDDYIEKHTKQFTILANAYIQKIKNEVDNHA